MARLSTPHSRFSPSHTNPLSALYRVDLFPTPSRSYFLPNQMDQSSRYTTGTTCIPSLFPPGVDPNTVDFRTFFPYIPNEVKHRKRTSRTQLKVLEDIFRKDTKPNAALRKKLAAELDMLPRAVQVCSKRQFVASSLLNLACHRKVWFQNRYVALSSHSLF